MFKKTTLMIIVAALLLGAGGLTLNRFKTDTPIKKVYPKAPLTVVLDWELTAPFELQIYYTVDKDEKFSYIHSVKKKVTPADKHVEIILPDEKIYKFRLDFGAKPERIELKNVEIIADQYINFNDWNSYAYMYIDKIKIHREDHSVTLISTQDDPHMSWSYPFVLYENK